MKRVFSGRSIAKHTTFIYTIEQRNRRDFETPRKIKSVSDNNRERRNDTISPSCPTRKPIDANAYDIEFIRKDSIKGVKIDDLSPAVGTRCAVKEEKEFFRAAGVAFELFPVGKGRRERKHLLSDCGRIDIPTMFDVERRCDWKSANNC